MTKKPTISVIVSTSGKNRAEGSCPNLLRRALDSILAQTFSDFELVLIDDASSDGTEKVCRQYAKRDDRIRFSRFESSSGYHAVRYNDGMLQSRGEFIAFMFDDDLLYPNALSVLLAGFEGRSAEVGMVYGLGNFYDSRTGHPIGLNFGVCWDPDKLRKQNAICNNAVLIRRHVIDHLGGWDEDASMRRICDWDHWLRIGSMYDVVRVETLVGEQFAFHRDSIGVTVPLDLAGAKARQISRKRVRLQDELGSDKKRWSAHPRRGWTPIFDV
jgi:glycosyltransferase involved in cell wall biosynthesis